MVSFYMSELMLGDNPHKNQVKQEQFLIIIYQSSIAYGSSILFIFSGTNNNQCWRRCRLRDIFFRKIIINKHKCLLNGKEYSENKNQVEMIQPI